MKTIIKIGVIVMTFAVHSMKADLFQDAERMYRFNKSSSYTELLTALNKAYSDFKVNPKNPIAMIAMDRVYSYVSSDKKIELNYDFLLQQSELPAKMAAIKGINRSIESGLSASQSVNHAIAKELWQNLAGVQADSDIAKAFAKGAVTTLLFLLDDHGLEAILTDRTYIENLQATDQWNERSPAETFVALEKKYNDLIGKKPGARKRAAIYELCRRRKMAGISRIESTKSVIDLSKF